MENDVSLKKRNLEGIEKYIRTGKYVKNNAALRYARARHCQRRGQLNGN